jgi:hypothetical protein
LLSRRGFTDPISAFRFLGDESLGHDPDFQLSSGKKRCPDSLPCGCRLERKCEKIAILLGE